MKERVEQALKQSSDHYKDFGEKWPDEPFIHYPDLQYATSIDEIPRGDTMPKGWKPKTLFDYS